jgi:hypothetical protein
MPTRSINIWQFSGSIPASGDLYLHGAHPSGGQPLQRAAPLHITERIQVVLYENTGSGNFFYLTSSNLFHSRGVMKLPAGWLGWNKDCNHLSLS